MNDFVTGHGQQNRPSPVACRSAESPPVARSRPRPAPDADGYPSPLGAIPATTPIGTAPSQAFQTTALLSAEPSGLTEMDDHIMDTSTQIPSTRPAHDDDLDQLDRLILAAEAAFMAHTGASQRLRATGAEVLSGGVASSWQATIPGTVWADHGAGSRLVDADGTEYVDLHGGFGVGLVGHAHPAIVEAVSTRVRRGTHFGQPVQDGIRVARALGERFGLPLWRFNNSGTESTMDAVHLLRVATGRPKIIKVEGTYHGHHDSVQVSVYPTLEQAGTPERPSSVSAAGLPYRRTWSASRSSSPSVTSARSSGPCMSTAARSRA